MTRIPRLFELMNQNGLKAKSLASQLPISEGNISDWKSGRSMPSVALIQHNHKKHIKFTQGWLLIVA